MTISSAELIERAREIAPRAAARAVATEEQRSPHDDTIQELIDAELFQILVPKCYGGHEAGIETHAKVIEIISAACMSTGWITAFYSGHNWIATKLPEKAQLEIFADRSFAMIPTSTAPTLKVVRDGEGFRLSGQSAWNSGIMHADWVMLGGMIEGEGPSLFTIPVGDVEVIDTWRMSGMAGTGSNDVKVENVYVPAHRVVSILGVAAGETEGSRIHKNPLYQMPMLPFLYMEALPVFSGGLRGATNAFEEVIQNRVTSYGLAKSAEQQFSHVQLGEIQARADVSEILVEDIIRRTQAAHAAGDFGMPIRTRLKGQAGFIVDHCRSSVNELVKHCGATNFSRDAPLQRFFRDLNMLSTHAFWDWDSAREQLGRNRLGLDPTYLLL